MTKRDPYSALRFREFRNFNLGRLFLTIGSQMQAVIVGWQVYELTHDPLSLGLIGLAEAVPNIAVSLFAGDITDKRERKKILMFSFMLMFACSVFLSMISADVLFSNTKVMAIFAVIGISGIARGFSMPAAFALMPQLLPREHYPNAISWNTTTWQTGAVVGPAIGGLVYGIYGVTASYLIVTALTLIALLFISTIVSKPVPQLTEHQGTVERLTAGIRFVFKNKIILSAISLDLFAVLFGGAVALLPIYSGEILHTGPQGLGLLRAAPSVGAVFMALLMARRPFTANAGRNLLSAVAGFGIATIIFAISKNFYLSLFMLALSGAFDAVSVVIRSTIIQLNTPENMKGRVSSVNSIFIGSSNEIGAFESGTAAKLIGVVPSVIFGGCMTLAIVGFMSIFTPKLRKLKL